MHSFVELFEKGGYGRDMPLEEMDKKRLTDLLFDSFGTDWLRTDKFRDRFW
jgi:hypothetical protein